MRKIPRCVDCSGKKWKGDSHLRGKTTQKRIADGNLAYSPCKREVSGKRGEAKRRSVRGREGRGGGLYKKASKQTTITYKRKGLEKGSHTPIQGNGGVKRASSTTSGTRSKRSASSSLEGRVQLSGKRGEGESLLPLNLGRLLHEKK